MAYVVSVQQAAHTRAESITDMEQYVQIIRGEKSIRSMASSESMSDDEARAMMETLRKMKQ